MTKEELGKEAEEYAKKLLEGTEFEDDDIDVCAYTKREMLEAILHFAEPREKQIQIDAEQIRALQNQNGELTDEVIKLKILVSSLVYEINQIWDINEMNDDLRSCAEKIDREVQLSKMSDDNRMVISALGFALVPPKPKVDVKEI